MVKVSTSTDVRGEPVKALHVVLVIAGFVFGLAGALLLGHLVSGVLELAFLSNGDLSGVSALIGWGIVLLLLSVITTALLPAVGIIRPRWLAIVHAVGCFGLPLVVEIVDITIRVVLFFQQLS